MNVKELIASQPPEAIAALLLGRFRNQPDGRNARERAMKRLIKFIKDLDRIKPIESGHLILGIFHVDDDGDYLDPCLYCKEELAAGFQPKSELAALESIEGLADEELERLAHLRVFPEAYAFEFSPWHEILGYEIDTRNACDVGATELCAAVIWEMTFFGFDEDRVEAERRKLDKAAREAEEIRKLPEEEQRKYYVPMDEVFAEFDIPEQTEEEKQEAHRNLCREVLSNNLRTYQALKRYVMSGT